MAAIALNARFYSHRPTGMQRYGIEMAKRLAGCLDVLRPGRPLRGAEGHLWEQFYLPTASRGRLLWSPNNTGPLAVGHQICTIHDIIPVDRPEWFSPRFAAWYQWLLPKLVHRVQHIIAISEFTKRRIIERFGVDATKITVVPNGIGSEFVPQSQPPGQYLLSVCSVEPRKNLPGLLRAWQRVAPRIPSEIELVLVGGKGASAVFQDAGVGELPPRVRFTGYVSDEQLPGVYAGALALIYPSLYEGFGLPPLEAMACGTPVVTSETTSLPEVVGEAALLVDPATEESIADGIRRIVDDAPLRDRLRSAGLARARQYTWDRSAEETRAVLSAFV